MLTSKMWFFSSVDCGCRQVSLTTWVLDLQYNWSFVSQLHTDTLAYTRLSDSRWTVFIHCSVILSCTHSPHSFPTKSKSVRNWNLSARIIKLTWIKSNILLSKDCDLRCDLQVPLYLDELLSRGNHCRCDGFEGFSELWLRSTFCNLNENKLQKNMFVTLHADSKTQVFSIYVFFYLIFQISHIYMWCV